MFTLQIASVLDHIPKSSIWDKIDPWSFSDQNKISQDPLSQNQSRKWHVIVVVTVSYFANAVECCLNLKKVLDKNAFFEHLGHFLNRMHYIYIIYIINKCKWYSSCTCGGTRDQRARSWFAPASTIGVLINAGSFSSIYIYIYILCKCLYA